MILQKIHEAAMIEFQLSLISGKRETMNPSERQLLCSNPLIQALNFNSCPEVCLADVNVRLWGGGGVRRALCPEKARAIVGLERYRYEVPADEDV